MSLFAKKVEYPFRKQNQVTCDSVNLMSGEKASDSCYMSTKTVAQEM